MRVGEFLALTLEDFDFDKNLIHITKSYARLDNKTIIGPPKTPKSRRDVSIPAFLVDEVQQFIQA